MKNKISLAAIAAVCAAASAQADPKLSATTATTQAEATISVIVPIAVTHVDGSVLSFGTFTVGTGGKVSVDATGAASFSGSVSEVTGSNTSADAFTVEGDPNRRFDIVTTNGRIRTGTDSMRFTTKPSANRGMFSSSGTANFTVGGVLTVRGAESEGVYTGNYDASVAYD